MGSLAIVGLGKLGLSLAACYASEGVQVVGVDIDKARVDAVNSRRADDPYEPNLFPMLRDLAPGSLWATTSIEQAVRHTDAAIIVVATPSESDGSFSLRYVLPACEAIGAAMRSKDRYLVTLSSTVMPGATGGLVRDALERNSNKRCPDDFGLCYVPEFIALGRIVFDYLNPALCIVGEIDRRAGDEMATILRRLVGDVPQIARTSLVDAEIAKVAINVMLTLKIGYANMLGQICQALPGADVDVVTRAIGRDPRVSPDLLRAGAAFGGPCFPRDVRAMANLAERCGVSPDLVNALGLANEYWADWIAGIALNSLPYGGTVGVLGLTYKPGVPLIMDSPGVWLIEALGDIPVVAHDPLLRNASLPPNAQMVGSVAECAARSDVIVITMPWPELDIDLLAEKIVIDCWRAFKGKKNIAVGRGLR